MALDVLHDRQPQQVSRAVHGRREVAVGQQRQGSLECSETHKGLLLENGKRTTTRGGRSPRHTRSTHSILLSSSRRPHAVKVSVQRSSTEPALMQVHAPHSFLVARGCSLQAQTS